MLSIQYFFLIYINNKKILIISLLYGWILINLLYSFNELFYLKKKYLKKSNITFFLHTKIIWKIFYIYILGYNLLHKINLKLFGTAYKINIRVNNFFIRFGSSNKLIISLLQNIKFFLIKKIFLTIKSRHWNLIKLLAFKLKQLSCNDTYKKKGVYFKNELIFLKQGKASKN